MQHLAPFDLRWIEEPTSPDDVLGSRRDPPGIAPVGVATGEHAREPRDLQATADKAEAIDYCQIDACRLGGYVNEVLAVLLLAANSVFRVPARRWLGLCEYVQHLSVIDYVCVSGSLDDRTTEFADHLHEHFVHPAVVADGRYVVPARPGNSVDLLPESYASLTFPTGCGPGRERARTRQPRRSATCSPAFSDADARATIDAAWDAGIRYFDTAPFYGYGAAEERLGRALRERPRDEYMLATKVGRVLDPAGFRARRDGLSRRRRRRAAVFDLFARWRVALVRGKPDAPRHRPHRCAARARSRPSREGGVAHRVPGAGRTARARCDLVGQAAA